MVETTASLSGDKDGSVPTEAVERSAQLYQQLGCQVQFERLRDTPHDGMLDGARAAVTLIRECALGVSDGAERSQG